jgi:hypothetical protein
MLVQVSRQESKMDWFWESEDEARSTFSRSPENGSEQVAKSMNVG